MFPKPGKNTGISEVMKPIDKINQNFIFHINTIYWKILFFIVCTITSFIEANERNDFFIYQLASLDVVNYINPYAHSFVDGYYYYYSLLFAYIIYPFTYLNNYWSTFIWLILNSYLLYLIIIQIADFIDISSYDKKTQVLFYTLLIIFNIRVIRENYHSAQVTILLLFLMIYALKFLWSKKYLVSSMLIALAVNIKLLALPILVYLLYRAYWKTFIYSILFIILFFTLPVIWLKKEFYIDCMHQWWMLINPNNDEHLIDVKERSFHSITTLISTLFLKNVPDTYALTMRRYIADLSVEQVKTIIQIVRIILISSVLLIIQNYPFQKPKNKFTLFYDTAYIIALIPLIFPHQQHYAFLLQMPALSVLIFYYMTHHLSKIKILTLFLIFLCFNLKVLLGVFNKYYEHFKILTYGGLMCITLLITLKIKQPNSFLSE